MSYIEDQSEIPLQANVFKKKIQRLIMIHFSQET